MSQMKRVLEEIESGFANPLVVDGLYVCANCFEEAGIQKFIQNNIESKSCNFCKVISDSPIAAPLKLVIDHIVECMTLEYDDPNNCLPWDSEEGKWVGTVFDRSDAFEDAGVIVGKSSGNLWSTLLESLDDRDFCKANPFSLSEDERLLGGWAVLAERLKSERRFFFFRDSDEIDTANPVEIFNKIGEIVSNMNIYSTIPAGTKLYRLRNQPLGKSYTSPDDLGPPPSERAIVANRMSPPGIVMFYSSEDIETAVAETYTEPGCYVCGTFELLKEIDVIDLTKIPPLPSLFDAELNNYREAIKFFDGFSKEISKPIDHDNRIHIEYIPTQVVTEYFREIFSREFFEIEGIKYRSAPRPENSSFVLFFTQIDVEGTDEQSKSANTPSLRLIHSEELILK